MAKQYIDRAFLEQVGKKMLHIRENLGLTQEQFAVKLDIDVRQLRRIERAEHNSSISIIKKIADALNLKISDILND